MPVSLKIATVSGLQDLDNFLKDLPEQLQRKMLYSSLMTAAKPIMDQAKANVALRFGTSPRSTGTLEKGITRGRRRKTGLAARVDVKLRKGKNVTPTTFVTPQGKRVTKKSGDDPFYGRFLEKGTRNMGAKPWLQPAGQQRQVEAGNKFRQATERQVAKYCAQHGITYKPGV